MVAQIQEGRRARSGSARTTPCDRGRSDGWEVGRQVFGVDKIDQRVIWRQIGNDHRSTDFGPVAQTHTRDVVVLDENPFHLGAIPDFATI